MQSRYKYLIANVATIIVVIACFWVLLKWLVSLDLGPTASDRITSASNGLVQLDSFIAAGFVVGFFYFWERMESQWMSLERKPPDEPFIVMVFPPVTVIALVASGVFALGAILTAGILYLTISFGLLFLGVWAVFSSWSALQIMLRDMEKHGQLEGAIRRQITETDNEIRSLKTRLEEIERMAKNRG